MLAAQRGLEKGESLLNEAIERGYQQPDAYLDRAQLRSDRGDAEGAGEDAAKALQFRKLFPHLVIKAARLLPVSAMSSIRRFPAVVTLDSEDRFWLADNLARWAKFEASTNILEDLADDSNVGEEHQARARSDLSLNYIVAGRIQDAIDLLAHDGRGVDVMDIRDAFNYSMARWAVDGELDSALFCRIVELSKEEKKNIDDANYFQCLTVAHWAVGDNETARTFVEKANHEAERERLIFSCWRYDNVSNQDFRADMREIATLIDGDDEQTPRFMRRDESLPAG